MFIKSAPACCFYLAEHIACHFAALEIHYGVFYHINARGNDPLIRFCEIKTTGWSRLDEHSFAFSGGGENILGWAVNNDWKFLSGNGSEAVYYRIVGANAVLQEDVLAEGGKITVSENITKTQLDSLPKDMQIKISATAVQYNGFSEGSEAGYTEAQRALAAWEAVKNK